MAPIQTRLDYLLSRYKTGLASEEERQELTILLEQDWDQIPAGLPADHIDWQRMLESIKQEGKRKTPVRRLPLLRSGWFRAAAVILFLAIGTGAYININRRLNKSLVARKMSALPADIPPGVNKAILTLSGGRELILDSAAKDTLLAEGADIIACAKGRLAYKAGGDVADAGAVYNTLTTPRGGQFQLTLPDGTRVWLNAASSIRYPTVFNGKERTVTVTGETYFEVAPKAGQPFMVQSGKMVATVFGTSFNINAYSDESMIRTSLIEGSLKVGEGNNAALLTPGQQAEMDKNDVIQVAKMSNPASAIAWKNGYFSFEKADIPTVMRQLSRWYNIEVSYEDGKAPADYFVGDLQRNARLSDILAVLAKSGISFTIKGNKLLVLNKHQINAG
jgi:transmembrane sensor